MRERKKEREFWGTLPPSPSDLWFPFCVRVSSQSLLSTLCASWLLEAHPSCSFHRPGNFDDFPLRRLRSDTSFCGATQNSLIPDFWLASPCEISLSLFGSRNFFNDFARTTERTRTRFLVKILFCHDG